jgi:glycosyltransferase involved in cell wall biosynthesis
MKTPRVSFVIPAYNAETYLAQAILSCRGQSIKELEIIVVNDGSTDGTRELVEWHSMKDERVRLINLDKNSGRSAARNKGNLEAKAPLILVLDADDISLPNRARDTIAYFELKKADVIYGPFQTIDGLGQIVGKTAAGPFNKELAIKHKMNFICHSTMAYRQGLTLNIKYDEGDFSHLGLDDWKFQWDAFLKGYKFVPAKQLLSQYRLLPGNTEDRRDQEKVQKVKDAYLGTIEERIAARL